MACVLQIKITCRAKYGTQSQIWPQQDKADKKYDLKKIGPSVNRESIINMTNADSDPEGSTFVSQTFSALHHTALNAPGPVGESGGASPLRSPQDLAATRNTGVRICEFGHCFQLYSVVIHLHFDLKTQLDLFEVRELPFWMIKGPIQMKIKTVLESYINIHWHSSSYFSQV